MASTILSYLGVHTPPATPPKEDGFPLHVESATRALPSTWYTSQEMYELERRGIFSRRWLLTTHKLRLKEEGDWLRYEIAGFDIVIAKDRKGNINAFHNICRHRAYPIVEKERGCSKILACRYHGWSYGLDGRFAKAPGYRDLTGFDKNTNNLFPIHVHIDHNGFIWLNLDASEVPEVPWEESFEGVDVQERYSLYNFADYEYDHTWEIHAEYNWKIAADNYNECYHCKTTHPDIPALADLESYDVKLNKSYIQHNAATTEAQREQGMVVASTYYFPNASTNIMPQFFFMQRFVPTGPKTTLVRYEVYRNKNVSEEQFKMVDSIYKRVMSEDKVLCTAQQKNLNAGVFVNGEMHPKMEKGPLFFQQLVREAVKGHRKREEAADREIWPAKQRLPANAAASKDDDEFCSKLSCEKEGLEW